ncbi:MAG: hypothetical protein WKF94_16240 [Solirubrobacteraceae bacterium]
MAAARDPGAQASSGADDRARAGDWRDYLDPASFAPRDEHNEAEGVLRGEFHLDGRDVDDVLMARQLHGPS